MGHLQQFKKETEQKTEADTKREEILHKVETQIEQEHTQLVEQQKKAIAEQKEKVISCIMFSFSYSSLYFFITGSSTFRSN